MNIKKISALVAAMAVSAVSIMSVTAFADKKDTYTFYMGGQFGENNFHNTNGVPVTVTQDGQYTFTFNGAGETNGDDFILYIDSDVNIYDYCNDDGVDGIASGNIQIKIDSVKVDGVDIAYTPSANCVGTGDDGNSLRVNIYNKWAGVTDVDPNLNVTESISVTFTVEGLFPAADPEPETTTAPETTTTAAGTTTTAGGTTTTAAGTTTAAATAENAATGDASGIVVVAAALAAAGGVALVTRKSK